MRDRRKLWNDFRLAELLRRCPHGQPGDRLWVRETWAIGSIYDGMAPSEIRLDALPGVRYPATQTLSGVRNRPSIHMPRWASRILLEITEIRVERLQDIPWEDARAEGIPPDCNHRGYHPGYGCPDCQNTGYASDPRPDFAARWNQINGKRANWNDNPYVWVIQFKKVEAKA
jgi:hypothetical protein